MDNAYDNEVRRLAEVGRMGDEALARNYAAALVWVPAAFILAAGLTVIFGTLEVIFALVNWAVNG